MSAFKEIWDVFYGVLTQPRKFFKEDFPNVSSGQAIIVGVLASVTNSLCAWIISSLSSVSYLEHFKTILNRMNEIPALRYLPLEKMAENQGEFFPAYLWNLGSLVFSPFSALIAIVVSAFSLMVGNALFGKSAASWDSLLKIAALCTLPVIFTGFLGFIPFGLSALISGIFIFSLQLIALVEVLQISAGRALAIALTPTLFVLLCACCILVPIVFFIGSAFHG